LTGTRADREFRHLLCASGLGRNPSDEEVLRHRERTPLPFRRLVGSLELTGEERLPRDSPATWDRSEKKKQTQVRDETSIPAAHYPKTQLRKRTKEDAALAIISAVGSLLSAMTRSTLADDNPRSEEVVTGSTCIIAASAW
jgi:hypothetical protein